MLIVFGGLPGTGKTTIAREVAGRCRATYLRIDTIEQAIRSAEVLAGDVGPAGYMAAYALAETNLKLGQTVVADCVNPLAVTRAAWRSVAAFEKLLGHLGGGTRPGTLRNGQENSDGATSEDCAIQDSDPCARDSQRKTGGAAAGLRALCGQT